MNSGMTAEEVSAMRMLVSRTAVIKAEEWLKGYDSDCVDAAALARHCYARGYIDAAVKAKQKLDEKEE